MRYNTTRRGRRFNNSYEFVRGLFVDGDGGAPAGGGVVAPAATAAVEASTTPTTPVAAPAATTPPGGATPAPAAEPPQGGIIQAVEAKPTVEDMRKFLTEKGAKPEELQKLAEADLQKQFDEAKTKPDQPVEIKPEDVKVSIPEGVTIDEKMMGEFQGIIADAKLSPSERAQKLVDMHVGALKAAVEQPYKLWTETQGKWQDQVKADKELGGTNFDTMRSTIAKAITDVGGEQANEMFEAFRLTGAANNPAVIRLVYRMSKLVVEGGSVSGGAPADAKTKGFGESVKAMYPSATGNAA